MLSNFNIYYSNANIIYNTFSRRLLELDKENYDKVCNEDFEGLDAEIYKKLITYKMVTQGKIQIKKILNEYYNAVSTTGLEFNIMASTACNFNCSYCYEDYIPKLIDEKFTISLKKFLENNISKYSSLFIDWFGGEPLLVSGEIINVMKMANEICKKACKPILSSITTNGYYLDYQTFSALRDNKVVYYQVTIDGMKETHDKYRPLTTGEGTYDRILSNLIEIKLRVPKYKYFRMVIRNNISKENYSSCKEFIKLFEEKFSDDERFQLFQYPVKNWGGERIGDLKDNLMDKTYITMDDNYYSRVDLEEAMPSTVCIAGKKNGYVLDPDLKIYKCNHFIQNTNAPHKNNRLGCITKEGSMIVDEDLNDRWVKKEISKKCLKCNFLASCLTTCPMRKIVPSEGCQKMAYIEIIEKIELYVKRKQRKGRIE